MRFMGLLIISVMLSACGQKGPLYLPTDTTEPGTKSVQQTAPAPANTIPDTPDVIDSGVN
jgi:predicted small lipoprotein YifL